jgi:hypothetical protein
VKQHGTKIVVADHWPSELSKLRCWIQGFKAGRSLPGSMNIENYVPGEDTIRQILVAISDTKIK